MRKYGTQGGILLQPVHKIGSGILYRAYFSVTLEGFFRTRSPNHSRNPTLYSRIPGMAVHPGIRHTLARVPEFQFR